MSAHITFVLDLVLLFLVAVYMFRLLLLSLPPLCSDTHRRPVVSVHRIGKRSLTGQQIARRIVAV